MEKKPIYKSKTVQGATLQLAAALVVVSKWLGVELPMEDVVVVLAGLSAIIGYVLTLYGRMTANQDLSLK